jgi:hypothetical protein
MALACSVRLCLCVGFERGRQGVDHQRVRAWDKSWGRKGKRSSNTTTGVLGIHFCVLCMCVCALGMTDDRTQPATRSNFVGDEPMSEAKEGGACAV